MTPTEQMSGHIPEKICISGLPFLYRQYNGEYTKMDVCEGMKWEKNSAIISKNRGFWELSIPSSKRLKSYYELSNDGCFWTDRYVIARGHREKSPLGDWGCIFVTEEENWRTWWRSNGTYVGWGGFILVLAYLFCSSSEKNEV